LEQTLCQLKLTRIQCQARASAYSEGRLAIFKAFGCGKTRVWNFYPFSTQIGDMVPTKKAADTEIALRNFETDETIRHSHSHWDSQRSLLPLPA